MSPPGHSSSNETPRSMKGDPTQAKGPNPAPLGAAFPHSYEFHTKRKMFDKGPEVQYALLVLIYVIIKDQGQSGGMVRAADLKSRDRGQNSGFRDT